MIFVMIFHYLWCPYCVPTCFFVKLKPTVSLCPIPVFSLNLKPTVSLLFFLVMLIDKKIGTLVMLRAETC